MGTSERQHTQSFVRSTQFASLTFPTLTSSQQSFALCLHASIVDGLDCQHSPRLFCVHAANDMNAH